MVDRDQFSSCDRTKAACERGRELWLDGGKDFEGREAGDCTAQRNAAVVWYFNVMRGHDIFSAKASMRECRSFRSFLLTQRDDIARVSQCSIVGITRPPGPNRKDVPRGKGWSCYAYTAPCSNEPGETCTSSRCFRNRSECTEQLRVEMESEPVEDLVKLETECRTVQKRAFVLTLGGQAHAFPTSAACDWTRFQLGRNGREPSRCEPLP